MKLPDLPPAPILSGPWSSYVARPEPRRRVLAVLLTLALLVAALLVQPAAQDGAGATPTDVVADRVLVAFERGTTKATVANVRGQLRASQASVIEPLGVHVWQLPSAMSPRALEALNRNPHVRYAELDSRIVAERTPNDPEYGRQWGILTTRTNEAWTVGVSTRDTVVAILDTGVSPVDDLRASLLPGRDVLNGTNDATDPHGHGTFAAGVAAASTDNGLGVAGYGWGSVILPVKVMQDGVGTSSSVAAGITWATDNGADVISMSLSGTSSSTTLLNAVRYAAARDVNLVAAAGNQGSDTPRFPAAYPEVIAVAGTQPDDALYSWSNFGSWVEVAAPGVNRSTARSGSYGNYAGTSSATPAVAGILALARAQGASAADARTALQETSVPLATVRHGRVDAKAMIDRVARAATSGPTTPPQDPEPDPSPTVSDPAPADDTSAGAKCHPKRGCDAADGGSSPPPGRTKK